MPGTESDLEMPASRARSSPAVLDGGAAVPPSLLYICGSGRSGSTLLDMLLGGHSAISAVGELSNLYFYARHRTKSDMCTCGRHVLDCPFWIAVNREVRELRPDLPDPAISGLITADPRLEALRDHSGRWTKGPAAPRRSRIREGILIAGSSRLLRLAASVSSEAALHWRIGLDRHVIYEAIRRAHGTPIIVDSTKTAGDMKRVYLARTRPMHLIYLVRDGRAVSHARMRRTGCSMEHAARTWAAEQRKQRAVQLSIPSKHILHVRYEELCRNPVRVLSEICGTVGLEYEPSMLDFRGDRHNIGGNPMRFRSGEDEIKLNERWKQELTDEDLRTFEREAGRANRRLGYFSDLS